MINKGKKTFRSFLTIPSAKKYAYILAYAQSICKTYASDYL